MSKKFGFLIYDNVQPMDVIAPWEVFSFWKNILHAPIEMYLIAENESVHCDNAITLQAHLNFANAPQLDCLIVPGGKGRVEQVKNERLIKFIQQQAKNCERILSVCTGAFLLHKAGLLTNQSATTYWRALPQLRQFTDIKIIEERIVKNEKIWLAGGVSSGLDLALAAIADFATKEEAGKVQLLFEYFPPKVNYADLKDVTELPPYQGQYICELPTYIKKDLQEEN